MRIGKILLLIGLTTPLATYSGALFSEQETKKENPFSLYLTSHVVDRAKFQKPHSWQDHHVRFSESKGLVQYTHKIDPYNGLKFGVGYAYTQFGWNKRPRVKEKRFENVLFSLGGYTAAQEKWLFDGDLFMQINQNHFALSRYSFFGGFLHGKYEWRSNVNFHTGICGTAGMRYTYILPIFGFDYQATKQLKLNAIFPTNISAVYSFNQHFSVDLSMRYLLTRQRLGTHEPHELKRGYIAYRTAGIELGTSYHIAEKLFANIHIGESLGGAMRVSHRNDKHRRHYRFKPAPYIGATAYLSF